MVQSLYVAGLFSSGGFCSIHKIPNCRPEPDFISNPFSPFWGEEHAEEGIHLLGDNLAALNGAISLRGRSTLANITKEMAWRKVRFGWRFAADNLPSENNLLADALSRLSAPGAERKEMPDELRHASARTLPDLASVWACS